MLTSIKEKAAAETTCPQSTTEKLWHRLPASKPVGQPQVTWNEWSCCAHKPNISSMNILLQQQRQVSAHSKETARACQAPKLQNSPCGRCNVSKAQMLAASSQLSNPGGTQKSRQRECQCHCLSVQGAQSIRHDLSDLDRWYGLCIPSDLKRLPYRYVQPGNLQHSCCCRNRTHTLSSIY